VFGPEQPVDDDVAPVVDLVDEDAARDCVMPGFDLGDGFPTAMMRPSDTASASAGGCRSATVRTVL
jgi:hypothetical protein